MPDDTLSDYQRGYLAALTGFRRLAREAEGRAAAEAREHRTCPWPGELLAVAAESRRAVWATVASAAEEAAVRPPSGGDDA